jgi:hypothetical protein
MIQAEAYRDYRAFTELAHFILDPGLPRRTSEFKASEDVIFALIRQDRTTRWSVDEHLSRANGALSHQVALLEEHGVSIRTHHRAYVAPDTSALLTNADLKAYRVPGSMTEVVVLPVVIEELDRLKDTARTAEGKKHAQDVIRQLFGLRSRGSLLRPQTVDTWVAVRAEAREPRKESYPPILNPEIADDRLIAGALTLAGERFMDDVFICSSDLNVGNKADLVGLTHLDPPTDPLSDDLARPQ